MAALADYQAAVLALNPSHYWRLNETEEGMAADSVGDLHGIHQGNFGEGFGEVGAIGPWVPGLEAENLAFGANNSASVGLGPGSALAASTMTIAAWFQALGSEGGDRLWTNNQTDPDTSFQIFFGGGSGDIAANIGIGLNPALNGFPAEGLPSGADVGNFHIPESIVAVKDGAWHHIVASRNGNNIEDVIVVIDGIHYDVTTWRDSTDTWGTTDSDAQLATRTPPDGGPSLQALNGAVDEVAVWLNRQLTVEEAINLYQASFNPVAVPGDYNNDGSVNDADYDVWKTNFGSTTNLDADGNRNNVVDAADYTVWRDNAELGGAATATGTVPEPGALVLCLTAAVLLAFRRST